MQNSPLLFDSDNFLFFRNVFFLELKQIFFDWLLFEYFSEGVVSQNLFKVPIWVELELFEHIS